MAKRSNRRRLSAPAANMHDCHRDAYPASLLILTPAQSLTCLHDFE